MKNIVIVTRCLFSGGAERVTAAIANYMDEIGISCSIIMLDEYEIFYSEYYAHVEYKKAKMRWNIRLNAFMVDYGWDGGWTSYTKKEFNEYFEIKN